MLTLQISDLVKLFQMLFVKPRLTQAEVQPHRRRRCTRKHSVRRGPCVASNLPAQVHASQARTYGTAELTSARRLHQMTEVVVSQLARTCQLSPNESPEVSPRNSPRDHTNAMSVYPDGRFRDLDLWRSPSCSCRSQPAAGSPSHLPACCHATIGQNTPEDHTQRQHNQRQVARGLTAGRAGSAPLSPPC